MTRVCSENRVRGLGFRVLEQKHRFGKMAVYVALPVRWAASF